MFKLFKNQNKEFEPLNYDERKYFENNLLWLEQEFPNPPISERTVFVPTAEFFPFNWNNKEEDARRIMTIVADQMNINEEELTLSFYDSGLKEIDMGVSTIFIESDANSVQAAGIFQKKDENGKYKISMDKSLVTRPDAVIATLAHELSHVKLLGEKQLDTNDEFLTDLTTIFFGFGVFNANTAFQFFKNSYMWGQSNLGYLKQDEWAYALALFAYMRNESKPKWIDFLNKSLKHDVEKCLSYIYNHSDEIFNFDNEESQN